MRMVQYSDEAVRVRHDLNRALKSLDRQALMGQSSFSSFNLSALTDNDSSSGVILHQASLKDDNRYQALAAQGEAGQLLAEYQQQRVETRRQAVDQYVNAYFHLARSFANEVDPAYNGDFSAERTSLQQLIEDPDSGQPLVGSEHRIPAKAVDRDQVLAFMQQHSFEITQVRQLYRELKESPSELEGWLQQQGIKLSAEMDAALDATRYNNTRIGDSRLDVLTTHTRVVGDIGHAAFHNDNGTLQLGATERPSRGAASDQWLASRLDQRSQSLKIADPAAAGFQLYLNESVPEQITQRDQNIGEMNRIQQQLGPQVERLFSLSTGNEHFSLQDMIANLVAQQPISRLNDGSDHPDAAEIEHFYQLHRDKLDHYVNLAKRANQPVSRGGMGITTQLYSLGGRHEVIRENIMARLDHETKEEILSSLDDPELKHEVQRYFDTRGFTELPGPSLDREPAQLQQRDTAYHTRPTATTFDSATTTQQYWTAETLAANGPDTLLNSIRDPLIKAALAQFLRP